MHKNTNKLQKLLKIDISKFIKKSRICPNEQKRHHQTFLLRHLILNDITFINLNLKRICTNFVLNQKTFECFFKQSLLVLIIAKKLFLEIMNKKQYLLNIHFHLQNQINQQFNKRKVLVQMRSLRIKHFKTITLCRSGLQMMS